jgi:hypothetical protein
MPRDEPENEILRPAFKDGLLGGLLITLVLAHINPAESRTGGDRHQTP